MPILLKYAAKAHHVQEVLRANHLPSPQNPADWVWRLWMERRPVELSDHEARLYDLTFFPLSARQFVDLARLGRWADQKPGDVLLRPNEPISELAVPLTESVDAKGQGGILADFLPVRSSVPARSSIRVRLS